MTCLRLAAIDTLQVFSCLHDVRCRPRDSHKTVSGNPGAVHPYLWLEEVEGAEALAWVAERNRAAHAALVEGQPGFDALRTHLWALVFRFLWEALGDA